MQELVDIMACQQITKEDDSMEFTEINEGNTQSSEELQPDTNNIPGPDLNLHSTVKDPEHMSLCTEELKPQALHFEVAIVGKQEPED